MANLIITETYLKQNSPINENVDMKVLTPIIILVQDMKIHPMLGSSLYNEIESQIGTNTVTALNQTLLDSYVLPTMVWYIMDKSTPAMKYRYMNKGIMVKNSENSAAADLQEIQFMMEFWAKNAEEYKQRCINYLVSNVDKYPLFTFNPLYSDIKPEGTGYNTGIYLEDDFHFLHRYRGENDPYRDWGSHGTSDIKNK